MPAPSVDLVPKEEYWGFVQKDISSSQLKTLASNIVASDNLTIDDPLKNTVLSFLAGDKVDLWSVYWVTIINTLGLGYSKSDNVFHATELSKYIANGGDIEKAYLLWALYFQFPFADNKHREYKSRGIVVNPVPIMLTALVHLFNKSKNSGDLNPLREAYLTAEEIVLVLMKSKSNDTLEVIKKADLIFENRLNGFDYKTIMVQGHDSKIDNFTGRARLYFQKTGIVKFSSDGKRVFISNWQHYVQCLNFLSFTRDGIKINIGSEEKDRVTYFEKSFSQSFFPDDFYEKLHSFDAFIDESNVQNDEVLSITSKLLASGNFFEQKFVERFLLSAKTKPFIILSGISGVGKSLLPKAIMKILGNSNCRPISVSPDWTDNSDMLGYFSVDEKFIAGEFTNVVLEASENPQVPYFVILDEMNLAKVEYYFAQVLSVMESRYFNSLHGKTEYDEFLFNVGTRKRLESSGDIYKLKLAGLKIPFNLVIIGTVNIDESTHPFSKKVLDRANVLEISDVDLRIGVTQLRTVSPTISIIPSSFYYVGTITNLGELCLQWISNVVLQAKYDCDFYIDKWISQLEGINEILLPHHLNFGLRMRDEVCIYMYYSALRSLYSTHANWDDEYFDHQLVQKVLTRLEGEEGELEPTLLSLIQICLVDPTQVTDLNGITDNTEFSNLDLKYPLTAAKIRKMAVALRVYQKSMVSFWTC